MKAVTVAGGSSDDPEIEAETTVLEGKSKATAEADADAGAGTEPEGEAAPQAERNGRTDADPDSELPGDADPRAAAESEAEGDPEGAPAAEVAAGTAAEAVTAEPKAVAGAEADTEPEDEAEPVGEARSEAEAETEATARAEAEAVTAEPKGQADAELPGDTDPEPGTALEGEADPEAKAESQRAGATEPEAEVTARAEAEAVTAEPKGQADAELPGDTDPEPGTALEGKADPEAKAESQRTGATEPEAEATARAEAEAVTAEPKTDADAKADAEPEDEAAPQAEPKGRADADSGRSGEAHSEPEGEAATQGGAKAAARSEAKSESEADGKDQAGAGSDVAPGPEAKGAPEADAPSDETMLIVLPKKKPAEPDAPRKAPSCARDVDPDPERTSQFVALKDVDLPAPVAPRAQPHSPGAKVAGPAPAAPLPPLDLLAELTNTPAPAETPRRTALRRVKIWTPILLLLVGAGAGAQLLRPLPTPQLVAAQADRTIDGQFSVPWPAKGQGAVRISGSGDIGTFGEQKPVPTASVAKVMTAYVILKGHPLRKADPGPDITIDAKTVADGNADHESRVEGLTVGQKFSQQDVLKMLMIPSGNNAARLLARWDTGTDSEAAFVAKMNAAAKELGMTNTTYTDPSGLDSGTVSTAVDQLKLAEAVMKDEVFRSIVALPNAAIKGSPARLENNNTLLTAQGLSIRGIKTGSSTPAGGALMWAAYKSIDGKDQLILGTLMDQHVDGPDEDGANSLKLVLANSKTIIEGVRTALASAPVIRKGDVVGHVDDGLGGRTPLVATKDLNVIGVPGQKLTLSLARTADAGPLPHTAKDGSEVAVLTVGSGEGAKSVPVAVKGALAEPSFGTRLTRGR
ncbi:D-alanyl-D-alanine carboxypeptidase [Streptomyces nojiriensis]|uniref:D-alanyl-D-alanine carboxypeptidase n=1 Tax=Streptomyces nojiriensis TaxID=66374 RepID=A0ABQ3SKB9_9ACTN|nr:serine hydrolase [Streptomyces nojiriensis]QTI50053.1 D-alanyl-D-alanine carboxypeptidase DacC [Streptomyces nojiriensis]GGS22483.1 D-alanyl-D-alanine carboxypeptidase [Streptomyces nojiriensis]GHI68452.1 D-alanyl-D-alanine carboxypeptidase [Streptomyces nojiriensis]